MGKIMRNKEMHLDSKVDHSKGELTFLKYIVKNTSRRLLKKV